MSQIKVEVGQFREVNKGALKAIFSLVIYPEGQKILDCRYFIQGDKRWFNFPQKEIHHKDGRKPEYIPYVSYLNKEYLEQLKIAVIAALKEAKPQEKHEKKKSHTSQGQEDSLPTDTSADWEEPPF